MGVCIMKRIPESKRESILVDDLDHCYVCGALHPHKHEVFFGTSNREKSKQYKMILPLCYIHHEGNDSPHKNREVDLAYKRMAQEVWENTYGTREDFIKEFIRSYL